MTSRELRQKYIEFFKERGHKEIPSASLVPENDPTVLFTTAGMHPLVPYLMGENHPAGKRIVNVQKCVRTGDIDDVGDNRHLTFFEMMGNWSFGNYFKKEAIEWSFEFLTDKKWLGLDPKRIYVTVFKGENGIPRDEDAIKIWQEVFSKVGMNVDVASEDGIIKDNVQIIPLGAEDNFWIAGASGPCGPDTEIFYDTKYEEGKIFGRFNELVARFRLIEIWNNVFMEFNKTIEGKYEKLKQQNVDTGMGLERTLAILNEKDTVFETDLFHPIFIKIEELSKIKYKDLKGTFRVIADHVRTSVFMISDGAIPSNTERGYVLRRLLRRAIKYGKKIEMPNNFLIQLAEIVINIYGETYPELEANRNNILDEIKKEGDSFEKNLKNGLLKINNLAQAHPDHRLTGLDLFILFSTYGFPIELSIEEIKERHIEFAPDELTAIESFNKLMESHKKLSRTASAGKFKGGLADASEETTRLHTVAHLLLESLRRVLGDHIYQKGSNINAERLRFDFSHPDKLTDEEKQKVEDLVNEQIQKKLPVNCEEMSLEEAKKINAMGVFENKYGERVKVYTIGKDNDIFSKEICGGPHVKNISELGKFKIKKEQSSSSGVRRIKAVLE